MGQAQVCWDNAMAESFWATLKTEYYYRRAFTTRDQVYTGVATWIEDFYNRRRIHTSLGGKCPPSNTNYTKRPGQQPHKQTVNNLTTSPSCIGQRTREDSVRILLTKFLTWVRER